MILQKFSTLGYSMSEVSLTPEHVAALKERFENAPFNKKLCVAGEIFEKNRAVLRMDFREDHVTVGDIVHGGAILGLIDCAATAAAWTTVSDPQDYRGITVDLTGNFIASARGESLRADARILKQGKTLTYLECEVTNEADELVSKSLITYKLTKG